MANTNLECAAMARPLITSNIHGCKEAVIDGESGFLCVEPQSGKVNGLNMEDGHTVLAPCEKIKFETRITK